MGIAEKSRSGQKSTEQADSSTPAGYTFIVTFLTAKIVACVARAFALFVAILNLWSFFATVAWMHKLAAVSDCLSLQLVQFIFCGQVTLRVRELPFGIHFT